MSSTAQYVIKESVSFHLSSLSPLVLASFSSWFHYGCSYSMGPFRPGSSQRKKMSNFFCLLHRLLKDPFSEVLSAKLSSCLLVSWSHGHSPQSLPPSMRFLQLSPNNLLEWRGCWEVYNTDHYCSVLLSVTEYIICSCVLILRNIILLIFMPAMNIVIN